MPRFCRERFDNPFDGGDEQGTGGALVARAEMPSRSWSVPKASSRDAVSERRRRGCCGYRNCCSAGPGCEASGKGRFPRGAVADDEIETTSGPA